jgi:lipopolysaccharide biosynthesis glycosyltransferase
MSIDNSIVSCPLVFACDPGYAMPLATTLLSVAQANRRSWPLQIYILACGFSPDTKAKIADSLPNGSCFIEWVSVDVAAFSGFSTIRHISSATYARFLMTNSLPEEISKVLYLDADILVLDDLGSLCETDLGGAVMGAVVDERVTTHIKMGNTSLGGLPLPRVQDYFNAGVLLIDLAKWRTEQISEKAVEYLELYPHSAFSDQDALNFACDGKWKRVPSRWNYYQIDLKKSLSDLSDKQRPGIIHFQGWSKPWDPGSLNINARFYDSFRSRTLFARTLGERWRQVPILILARLKSILKRSGTIRQLWNRLTWLHTRDESKSARRVSA